MPRTAVNLFCGIGGLTKGLNMAGINAAAVISPNIQTPLLHGVSEKENMVELICTYAFYDKI